MIFDTKLSISGDLLSHPTFKPLCSPQHEHFIESEGKESSLIIELKPGSYGAEHASCARILSAPPNYGFIVRLILPKLQHRQPLDVATTRSPATNIMAALAGASNSSKLRRTAKSGAIMESSASLNSTKASRVMGRTCPLNIVSELTLAPISGDKVAF